MLCNLRSAHVESSVRSAHKVRKQRRLTEQLGLKAGQKDDLRTAWIYPHPSGSTAPSHSGLHRSIPHGVSFLFRSFSLRIERWCLELSLWHSVASFLTLQICQVRRQYEVVSLGFVFDLLSVLLPTVAAFCLFLIKDELQWCAEGCDNVR